MRGACLEYRIEAKFNKGLPGNNLWAHIRHGPGGNYGLQLKHWRFSREEMLCPLVISFLRHNRWYGLRHRPTLSHLFKDLNGGCRIRKTMVMFAQQPHIQLRFWVFSYYLKWMQSNYLQIHQTRRANTNSAHDCCNSRRQLHPRSGAPQWTYSLFKSGSVTKGSFFLSYHPFRGIDFGHVD